MACYYYLVTCGNVALMPEIKHTDLLTFQESEKRGFAGNTNISQGTTNIA